MCIRDRALVGCLLAIYQIMLGWKTHEHYHETDEIPIPRPTQPKKKQVKSGIWATFSHSKMIFAGWDWFYMGNRIQENKPDQIIRKHGNVLASVYGGRSPQGVSQTAVS